MSWFWQPIPKGSDVAATPKPEGLRFPGKSPWIMGPFSLHTRVPLPATPTVIDVVASAVPQRLPLMGVGS